MSDPILGVDKPCRDCGTIFKDAHNLFTKCEMCRERDQLYRERAIQDSLGYEHD